MTPSLAIEILKAGGLTEQVIGAAVGAGQSTINRIRNGAMQPNWALGQKLVDMARAAQGIGPAPAEGGGNG